MVSRELKKDSFGLLGAIAQGIGMNGPAATISLYFVGLSIYVGKNLPLAVIFAWIVYLSMTLIMYEWSKILSGPHPWAIVNRMGLGKFFAFYGLTGYWLYYILGFSGFAALGFSNFLYLLFPDLNKNFSWIIFAIILIILSSFISYKGIKISIKYQIITGFAEVIFLNLTSIALIILAGNRNTVDVFYPISGNIFIASIFAISTFGGLNGVIPLSMESRDPRKTVPRSLIIVSIILGITIIMNSYAQTIIFGPSNMSYYSSIPDPGILIYSEYLNPIISFILILFVINSFLSSGIAVLNNSLRMSYGGSMEDVLFLKSFSLTNRYGTPYYNLIFTSIISTIIVIFSGLFLGPLIASVFLLTMAGFFSFTNHMFAGISLLIYNYRRKSLKIFRHLFIPIFVTFVIVSSIIIDFLTFTNIFFLAMIFSLIIALSIFILYLILKLKNPYGIERVGTFIRE